MNYWKHELSDIAIQLADTENLTFLYPSFKTNTGLYIGKIWGGLNESGYVIIDEQKNRLVSFVSSDLKDKFFYDYKIISKDISSEEKFVIAQFFMKQIILILNN